MERERLIDSQDGRQSWYPDRPGPVTRNDYGLGLMNGDIAITLDMLRPDSPPGDGTDRIKWVLPDAPNPILTRELVYTGITRTRHWLTLVETGCGQLMDAAQKRVMRVSRLGKLEEVLPPREEVAVAAIGQKLPFRRL